uniref:hypothetical protein n=1 Tax=Nocardia farcinica TaxID=37329 RepID=UPI001E5A8893
NAASLKRELWRLRDMPEGRFPRSKERGLIEAWLHHVGGLSRIPAFRVRKNAASLKLKVPVLPEEIAQPFRVRKNAASLKLGIASGGPC